MVSLKNLLEVLPRNVKIIVEDMNKTYFIGKKKKAIRVLPEFKVVSLYKDVGKYVRIKVWKQYVKGVK